MNFLLERMEAHLGEECLAAGKKLYENGRVGTLRELERHLWIASVHDGEPYEVEVKLSPSKVLAASCDCRSENGQCAHLAAILFALRANLEARNRQKAKKKAGKNKPARNRLSVAAILQDIPPGELAAFVEEYARVNRAFALAIKARFVAKVIHDEGPEKFRALLNAALEAPRRANQELPYRSYFQLSKVLGELLRQAEQALIAKRYVDVLEIAQSIVEKVSPLVGKVAKPAEGLRAEVERAAALFQQLADSPIAPDLRERLWEYLLDEHRKLVYRNRGLDYLFFQALRQLAREEQDYDRLLEALKAQQERYASELRDFGALLRARYDLLARCNKTGAARQLLEQYPRMQALAEHAVFSALDSEKREEAKRLLDIVVGAAAKYGEPHWLLELRVTTAERLGHTAELADLLARQFLESMHEPAFQRLKALAGNAWEGRLHKLIEQAAALPEARRRNMIAWMLFADKRQARLY
jgi:hypothetical protein